MHETFYAPLCYYFGYGLCVSHCAYPELRYSHNATLFVIVVLGGFSVISSSNLSGGDGSVDLVFVGGVLQGCSPLLFLFLPRVFVVAVVVSL